MLMANEMGAYVQADISTFLAYNLKSGLDITSLVEEDPIFLNVYAAIAIDPEMHSKTKIDIANQFINWLISDEVQEIIEAYGQAELTVEPVPHLVDPVAGLAVEQPGERVAVEVVAGGHARRA